MIAEHVQHPLNTHLELEPLIFGVCQIDRRHVARLYEDLPVQLQTAPYQI